VTAAVEPAAQPVAAERVPPAVDGRTWHYRDFYGLGDPAHLVGSGAPRVLVHGNCQAESLRVVLAGATDAAGHRPLRTVRVPPVHELTAADVAPLHDLLERCDAVVSQPVRSGYHDLPLGTADVLARAPRARSVVVPVVRDGLLRPTQALIRVPGAGEPPVVPYHDLRTLALAADALGERPTTAVASGAPLAADAVREVGRCSREELRARQHRHGTLAADDLLDAAGTEASHTLNHPGNPVLVGLAQRVLDALGLDAHVRDPGRVLLRSVLAPLDPVVLAAHRLDPDAARDHWLVDGRRVEHAVVREAQLAWYAERPHVVRAGLERHGATMAVLGL
jgi:hypothetical protein